MAKTAVFINFRKFSKYYKHFYFYIVGKSMSTLVDKAKKLAFKYHKDQRDRAGKPYLLHLEAVANGLLVNEESYICVAWLHDIIEDHNYPLEQIRVEFGDEIASAVLAISKVKDEDYQDYLNRVKANEIARIVKLSDLNHNMQLSRLPKVTSKDLQRVEKYKKAREFLEDKDV